MKVLLPLFFLIAGTLYAQDHTDRIEVPGPGDVGDSFELTELDVRIFNHPYCVVGNSLYRKFPPHRRDGGWLKVAEMPVPVLAFDSDYRTRDSIIRLWTGNAEYVFNVKRGILEKIDAFALLTPFLHYPIIQAYAAHAWSTCGGAGTITVAHSTAPTPQTPSLRHEVRSDSDNRVSQVQVNGVDIGELTWALRSVNLAPHRIPTLDEFEFDAGDLLAFRERVDEDVRLYGRFDGLKGRFLYAMMPIPGWVDQLTSIPDSIGEIGPEIVGPALVTYESVFSSTAGYADSIALINERGDTLFASFRSSSNIYAVYPYWTIRYNDTEFRCSDPKLSRLLTKLLPEDRSRWRREEKVDLLYAVGWQRGLGRWE